MSKEASDRRTALVFGAVMAVIYALTVPTGLMGADNAEFATLAVTPGVAHPPGYPLYTLYLRAASTILGAFEPAHAAGIATAFLGAGAIGMAFLACRNFGLGWRAALLACLVVGFDLSVWSMHSHAEVFALNDLIAASIFWAAAPGSRRGLARAATLGLLAGLGMANHHSIVLLAPIGLWGLWRATTESTRRWLAVLAAVVMALAGLSTYLYLLASASDCVDCLQWGRFETFGDLLDHFLRADYGTTRLSPDGASYDPVTQWGAFAIRFLRGSFGIVALAALTGAVSCWRERRGLLVAVASTFLLTGVVFIGMFNVAPEGIGEQIVSRFYALPVLVLFPLVAAGFERIARLGTPAMIVAGLAALIVTVVNAAAIVDQHHGVIDAYLRDTLTPLPPDAIVFGTGDHRTFGVAYQQQVRQVRRDIDWIDGKLLAYDWYVERLERRLDRDLPRTDEDGIPIVDVVTVALTTGRPVFLANRFVDAFDRMPTYPIGTVIRVLPPGQRPPPPDELAARNAQVFAEFQLEVTPAEVSNPWEVEVYHHYRRPWRSLAEVFERMRDDEAAARARTMEALYSAADGGNAP